MTARSGTMTAGSGSMAAWSMTAVVAMPARPAVVAMPTRSAMSVVAVPARTAVIAMPMEIVGAPVPVFGAVVPTPPMVTVAEDEVAVDVYAGTPDIIEVVVTAAWHGQISVPIPEAWTIVVIIGIEARSADPDGYANLSIRRCGERDGRTAQHQAGGKNLCQRFHLCLQTDRRLSRISVSCCTDEPRMNGAHRIHTGGRYGERRIAFAQPPLQGKPAFVFALAGRGNASDGMIQSRAENPVAQNAVVGQRHHDPFALAEMIHVAKNHAASEK